MQRSTGVMAKAGAPTEWRPYINDTPGQYGLRGLRNALGNQAFGHLVQAKLRISEPGDSFEQEADRVADEVMRAPDPTAASFHINQRSGPSIQRACASCEEEEAVQRKAASGGSQASASQGDAAVATRPSVGNGGEVLGGGQPLRATTRAFFEPRFGHDFGGVRVHTGGEASESARSIDALAYTSGRDIVFRDGLYSPDTDNGRRLLAHELTHVIQQSAAPAPRLDRQADASVPSVSRRTTAPVIQRRVHEGHDHGGRYEIDDQTCKLSYHQNWFFTFTTNQTQAERIAYMDSAKTQIEDVWSRKFPLIPDMETCPCHPDGITVEVHMHPVEGERQGRGFSVTVHPNIRAYVNPPFRGIHLEPGDINPTPFPGVPGPGLVGVVHEFGHAIGLSDEYSGWASLFRTEGSRDRPSIMHNGDQVRPRHYQHFADLVNHELGAGCTYRPAGLRMFAYENPVLSFTGQPFGFLPTSRESMFGISGDYRLSNEAIGGLFYPTVGLTTIWDPRDQSVRTGPTASLRLNQLAHPLYANLRTGLLFDPQSPESTRGLSLPLSVDLGIRHDQGFQVGVNYTAIADLLGRGGWTHLVGLGLSVELP
jgi:hypothetical protein